MLDFFHTGYSGMKDRPVMGMDGHGGQSILIDFEKGRIVATMAVHLNYNWKKLFMILLKREMKKVILDYGSGFVVVQRWVC